MYMYMLCCFALFVCLTLLASFFLPSHLSFKNMYIYMNDTAKQPVIFNKKTSCLGRDLNLRHPAFYDLGVLCCFAVLFV